VHPFLASRSFTGSDDHGRHPLSCAGRRHYGPELGLGPGGVAWLGVMAGGGLGDGGWLGVAGGDGLGGGGGVWLGAAGGGGGGGGHGAGGRCGAGWGRQLPPRWRRGQPRAW